MVSLDSRYDHGCRVPRRSRRSAKMGCSRADAGLGAVDYLVSKSLTLVASSKVSREGEVIR